jgi:hypothetical protein
MEIALYYLSVAKLALGILAIQDPGRPVDTRAAVHYAVAAMAAADRYKVDPWELIAVARNESSFKVDDLGPDGKDCGITQTRVTASKYSCRQLRTSYWLGFMEGARELSEFRSMCRKRPDFDRCRFNRYNSGIHYARRGWAGHYWLRVLCYRRAAQQGVTGNYCGGVETRREVAQAVARAQRVLVSRLTRGGATSSLVLAWDGKGRQLAIR